MASRLITAGAAVAVLSLLLASVAISSLGLRLLCVALGAGIAFLLGVGVGERSKSFFCQHLLRVNSLLADQVRALSDENLSALRPRPTEQRGVGSTGGPHQLELRGRSPQ